MTIAIDFDGTCVRHAYPDIGENIPHAERVIKRLVEQGHQIILWTMRSDRMERQYLVEACTWFESKNIPLYGVNYNPSQGNWTESNKAYAQVYIDDAALGCPLIYPDELSRPYVDWLGVEKLLESQNILK